MNADGMGTALFIGLDAAVGGVRTLAHGSGESGTLRSIGALGGALEGALGALDGACSGTGAGALEHAAITKRA